MSAMTVRTDELIAGVPTLIATVQRVARTYFKPENRLVLTLMPSGKAGAP